MTWDSSQTVVVIKLQRTSALLTGKGFATIAQAKFVQYQIEYLPNDQNDKVRAAWVAKKWTGPLKFQYILCIL